MPSDPASVAAYLTLHEALKSEKIKGYFSEAVAALDLLGREDKVDVVGEARVVSATTAIAGGSAMSSITVGTRWPARSMHQKS